MKPDDAASVILSAVLVPLGVCLLVAAAGVAFAFRVRSARQYKAKLSEAQLLLEQHREHLLELQEDLRMAQDQAAPVHCFSGRIQVTSDEIGRGAFGVIYKVRYGPCHATPLCSWCSLCAWRF